MRSDSIVDVIRSSDDLRASIVRVGDALEIAVVLQVLPICTIRLSWKLSQTT
jgi:hypothetical protein